MNSWIFIVLLVQLFSCVFMTGLIWIIQLVHYPSFRFVSAAEFSGFTQFHNQRITMIVLPMMLIELVSAAGLCWLAFAYSDDISPAGNLAALANLGGVGVIWLTTFFASVPAHEQLASGKDAKALYKLVSTNWIRTFFWSLRSLALAYGLWLFVQHFFTL